MSWADDPDGSVRFAVVLNHEEQYSVWPQEWGLPAGWRAEGYAGSRADCLTYIDEVWTDMRPLSVRLQSAAPQGAPAAPDVASTAEHGGTGSARKDRVGGSAG